MAIRGISVTLYERVEASRDAMNATIYQETPVVVENVLVSPVSAEEELSTVQLTGKHAVYELSLPKSDSHAWDDCRVDFFGRSWRVIGPPKEWIEAMIPGDWNVKRMVERYE